MFENDVWKQIQCRYGRCRWKILKHFLVYSKFNGMVEAPDNCLFVGNVVDMICTTTSGFLFGMSVVAFMEGVKGRVIMHKTVWNVDQLVHYCIFSVEICYR